MGKVIKDGDLLNAMEMMLDYEPTVYGFNGHYYNTNLYAVDDKFDVHTLDGTEGKMWTDNCIDENKLETKQVEWLKSALHLYY